MSSPACLPPCRNQLDAPPGRAVAAIAEIEVLAALFAVDPPLG